MRYPVLALIFIAILFGCKKKDIKPVAASTFPTATQTGANVLAWKTDSVVYVCKDANMCYLYTDTNKNNFSYRTGYFQIQTILIDNKGFKRAIRLTSPQQTPMPIVSGTIFPIDVGSDNALAELPDSDTNPQDMLMLGGHGGQMVITHFDAAKKIISGTFYFRTSYGNLPSRNIQGWFDITYYSY